MFRRCSGVIPTAPLARQPVAAVLSINVDVGIKCGRFSLQNCILPSKQLDCLSAAMRFGLQGMFMA